MQPSPLEVTRRRVNIAGTAIAGAVVSAALGVPIIGFLLSPILRRTQPLVERRVGYVGDLPLREPRRFVVAFPQDAWPVPDEPHTVYVVRDAKGYRVFANICTHMQCPVHFDPAIKLFLCPCHGGLYDLAGNNVGGPPPKPLPEYRHRIDADGVLYVRNQLNEEI